MAASGAAVAYCATGGLVLYSGIKGATLADTVKSVLTGNLSLSDTETVDFSTPAASGSSSSGSSGSSSAAAGDTGAANAGASANQALAKKIIQANSAYSGWDSGQNWSDLVSLWNQESGWNNTADNTSSGAYGIPQSLPYSKMPKAAWPPADGGSADPTAQIEWGLSYIASTYGSPVMAWAHETANNWY